MADDIYLVPNRFYTSGRAARYNGSTSNCGGTGVDCMMGSSWIIGLRMVQYLRMFRWMKAIEGYEEEQRARNTIIQRIRVACRKRFPDSSESQTVTN